MFVALWEVFLEGFCVVLAVGVVAVVALVSIVLSVGAAAVGVWLIIAAVVLNGPAAVAVGVPAVVVVVVVGVVPVGVVAAVFVLLWVCDSGVVSQGWVGELVEGRSGVWVDGALRGGVGRGVVGWVDEDVGEEDGVEEFLEAGRGVRVGVEAVAVFEEGEGFFEAVVDCLAVGGQGGEFSAGVVEFAGEAGLLGFEQVEGDGLGVVGLEECGLLGFERARVGGESAGVGVLAVVEAVEFGAQACCDGASLVGGDVDVAVEVGDGVVDVVDEDGFEGALVAVALAVGADEIGVDVAVSGFGVVDDEPAAALAAADGG